MAVIIITPPPKKDPKRESVETDEGAAITQDGQTVATFTGPNAYENAIKYLKVMKG